MAPGRQLFVLPMTTATATATAICAWKVTGDGGVQNGSPASEMPTGSCQHEGKRGLKRGVASTKKQQELHESSTEGGGGVGERELPPKLNSRLRIGRSAFIRSCALTSTSSSSSLMLSLARRTYKIFDFSSITTKGVAADQEGRERIKKRERARTKCTVH